MNKDNIYPNINQSIYLFAFLISAFLIYFLVVFGLPKLLMLEPPSVYFEIATRLAMFIPFPFIIYGQNRANINVWKMIQLKNVSCNDYVLLALIAICIAIIIHPLANPFNFLKSIRSGYIPIPSIHKPIFNAKFVIDFIGLVLITPVLEEAFLRGLILNQFLKRYNVWLSLFITSMYFALAHINLTHFEYYFVWGILLGFIYYKTNSLFFCIILHLILNLLSLMNHSIPIKITNSTIIISTIIYIVALTLLFLSITKLSKFKNE